MADRIHKTSKDGYRIVERDVPKFFVLDPDGKVVDVYVSLADATSEFRTAISDDKRDKARRSDKAGPEKLAKLFPMGGGR